GFVPRRTGHDPRRRAGEPPGGRDRHGRAREARLHAAGRRDRQRLCAEPALSRAASGTAAHAADPQQARRVYGRLLRYARPHVGMYLIGVLGMMLYAGSDLATIDFTKNYMSDVLTLEHNSHVLSLLPLGVILIFLVRGIGDYLANYFPSWVGRQVIKTIRGEL